MIQTIWTYRVKPERQDEFERRYCSDGDWAKLFSRAEGYRGTTLLKDRSGAPRYSTVDQWESIRALERFKEQFGKEYADLDAICGELTESEEHLGIFDVCE